MSDPATWSDPDAMARLAEGMVQAQEAQRSIVKAARAAFGGRLTYAAGSWEQVEWDLFDIVSVDAYRDAGNADAYREIVRGLGRFGKPVAITEFGCCTYGGASSRGGNGWMIVDQQADPPSLNGDYRRDEGEQVRCFSDLMAIFDREGVDSAFWFTFAGFALPHREDPTFDLDMASYGVVAVSEPTRAGQGWREKQVFRAIAADYGRRHSLAASGAGAGTRAQAK
jgi:hypothetical protein